MDRRQFLKAAACSAAGVFLAKSLPGGLAALAGDASADGGAPAVYMTKNITPAGLAAAYKALGAGLPGKVAVKLSMGEPGGHHYPAPALIKDLVQSLGGTIVDGNTAYGGKRSTTEAHMQTARDHGFTAIAPVDILDAEGEIRLPIAGGTHLEEVRVGSHFSDYDSMLVLSHFKGHLMGGYGGALKNIAIGVASPAGKCLVHTAGNSETDIMDGPEKQEHFLEAMAEASEGMIRAMRGNMLYVSIMNNLSVDCDCDSNPSKPELPDIGILSSRDPVALDQACIDLVYAADAKQSASLRERIESRKGPHILAHAEKLGLGSRRYALINLD